jgi:molecular chaperone DnaK
MKFLPGKTVGIDLGTTFSAIAYLNEQGKPVTVPNREGGLITPSVVWLGDPRRVVVGPKAYQAAPEHPDQVIQGIKREMGNETFKFEYGDVTVGPEAISAMILRKLKVDAELFFKGVVANAVITVPAYFNDSRRKATQDAGAIAGLNVLEIINEPTAATLAYAWTMGQLGLAKSDDPQARTVLVYDLGGGTFDVTAVRYQGSEFRVLATDGDVRLGGIDWTRRLADDIAQKFIDQGAPDVRKDPHLFEGLVQRSEVAKRSLSGRPRANIRMKIGDKNFIAEVTRDRFEQLTADLLQRTRDTTQTVLEDAGLNSQQVDRFILVGGSTRMPSVINMMKELGGKDPYADLSPDEAVAMGAAIQAAILQARHRDTGMAVPKELSERLENVKQVNVNSHSLGILALDPQTGKDSNFVLIRRNTPIPCSYQQRFVTRGPNQQRVRVRILEGDAPDPTACYEIGQCIITDLPPNLPDRSPVEVTYSFDANGRIEVHAKDVTGGREARTEIERATGLRPVEVNSLAGVVSDLSVE